MPNPNQIAYLQRTVNHVDGLSLNSAVYNIPWNYFSMCYDAMRPIRQANNYRPKIYAIPDQSVFGLATLPTTVPPTQGIPNFGTYVTQARVVPGTVVYGMTIAAITWGGGSPGAQSNVLNAPNNLYFNVVDDATGVPLFSSWLADIAFNVPILYQSQFHSDIECYVAKSAWLPLTKPRTILAPGVITVEMCYKGGAAESDRTVSPQIILQCGEPCGNAATALAQGVCQ